MSSIEKVEFYRHALQEADVEEVRRVLGTLFLTTGPVTKRFEEKFAAYLGRSHAVGTTSCTASLFLSLAALGIGPGDEVIVPAQTFIASANVIVHAGATPVLVDVEPDTALIDPARVAAAITPRTKAVIPVHLYGQMADMRALHDLCAPRGIALIEDAAHGPEARRDGVAPGELGTTASFSFYATKTLTCGEGGAVATDDPALDERLRKLRSHGMSKNAADRYTARYQHWDMELLGYKANLPDVLAALLVHQIDRIDAQRDRREAICQRYEAAFAELPGVDYPKIVEGSRSARHLFTIWVPADHRDEALVDLQERGIGVAVNYRAIHLLTYYRDLLGFERGAFPNAESIGDRTISLPLYPGLTDPEVDRVIEAVRAVSERWR
ncbi:MAG: DegT/DnrJ/EryC1/StrS family aminotransferase [Myxococcales bacterium]|nr:DegT/DnrJ/EryC1/StrS family aminotransferase [Myxococcales bacterium]